MFCMLSRSGRWRLIMNCCIMLFVSWLLGGVWFCCILILRVGLYWSGCYCFCVVLIVFICLLLFFLRILKYVFLLRRRLFILRIFICRLLFGNIWMKKCRWCSNYGSMVFRWYWFVWRIYLLIWWISIWSWSCGDWFRGNFILFILFCKIFSKVSDDYVCFCLV